MREISGQRLLKLGDRGGNVYSGVRFTDCTFDNCHLSLVDSPSRRSTVASCELIRCRDFNSEIGPARFEDVIIDDFRNDSLTIVWAPLLRHVTLRGVIRSIKVNRSFAPVHNPIRQRQFDDDAAEFYKRVDWALDLTAAKLSTCELQGIPLHLVRFDPKYGLAISRQSAERPEWRREVAASNPWLFSIDLFLRSEESERLLIAPHGNAKKRRALDELRAAGLGSAVSARAPTA